MKIYRWKKLQKYIYLSPFAKFLYPVQSASSGCLRNGFWAFNGQRITYIIGIAGGVAVVKHEQHRVAASVAESLARNTAGTGDYTAASLHPNGVEKNAG